MTNSAGTLFPLGAAVGGPNGSDPAAQARFEARFQSFTKLMGSAPEFMNAFVDSSKAIGNWASNASWTAWSWAQSPLAKSTTPVIGLPMATEADRGNPGAVYRAFASGQHDAALRGIVKAWTDQGFGTLYFRPGYEMNETSMPWYAGSDAQTQADWVAAFRRIADVLHSVPGADVKVIWNPNVRSWNGNLDVRTLYPGDRYVDVVGADMYSPVHPHDLYDWSRNDGSYNSSLAEWAANPVNRQHYWDYPSANRWHPVSDGQGNSLSLQDLIDFAKAHNKPLAIGETGSGGDGTHGPTDDGAFPQWLASKLAASGVNVAMVNIWDQAAHDADWSFSNSGSLRPSAAAAWSKAFGADSGGAAPVTLGTGPDAIVLQVSEDAWRGDAQFTVSVDGKQVGGVQTATALHGQGRSQAFKLLGSFGAGQHSVAVTFLNDAWGGTADTDRNLYVDSVTSADGTTVKGGALFGAGTQTFTVGKLKDTTVGAGPDSVVLRVSEDAWQGDAQFTVRVNGQQVGSVLTATASHASGQSQAYTLTGNFGAGQRLVDVTFLNDAWGGTAATDRNLYVDSVTSGDVTVAGGALFSNGTKGFQVGAAATATIGAGPDKIVLRVSEDAWQGDAQFTVQVNGQQVGGVLNATAAHAQGQSQALTVLGSFGAGQHAVTVNFLNDAWGGTAATDRNLYVDSVSSNGGTVAGGALMSAGARTFYVSIDASTLNAAPMAFAVPEDTSGPGVIHAGSWVSTALQGDVAAAAPAWAPLDTALPAPAVTMPIPDAQAPFMLPLDR